MFLSILQLFSLIVTTSNCRFQEIKNDEANIDDIKSASNYENVDDLVINNIEEINELNTINAPYYTLSNHFKFYYEDQLFASNPNLTFFINKFETAYNNYLLNGFHDVLISNNSYYEVYLLKESFSYYYDINKDYSGNTFGIDFYKQGNNFWNKCTSYIEIYDCDDSLYFSTEIFTRTIYHELFHAIQFTYNYRENWFLEASASFMEYYFYTNVDGHAEQIKSFLNDYQIYTSVGEVEGYEYGACLFLYFLSQKFDNGNLNIIKNIYEQLSEVSETYTESGLEYIITQVLHQNGFNNASFGLAYSEFLSWCSFPLHNFNDLLSGMINEDEYLVIENANPTVVNSSNYTSLNISCNLENGIKKVYYYEYQNVNGSFDFNVNLSNNQSVYISCSYKKLDDSFVGCGSVCSNSACFHIENGVSMLAITIISIIGINISETLNFSSIHTHNYAFNYVSNSSLPILDDTTHRCLCDCGQYITRKHTVRSSEIVLVFGRQMAPCIYCGDMIDLTRIIVYYLLDNFNNMIITLPNGIEIIVDGGGII
jgi:hypothetical protein